MAEYYAAWLLVEAAVSRSVSAISIALYYLSYPVLQLIHAVILALTPLIALVRFVLLPLTYVTHTIVTLALLPFRLRLLDRLEVSHSFLLKVTKSPIP